MLNESIPTASARTASSTVLRITTSPLSSSPESSTVIATNESNPNSTSWVVIGCSSPQSDVQSGRARGWFLNNRAPRRCHPHRADQKVVEGRPLVGAQGTEQVVLDKAEARIGSAELFLASG